VNKLLIQASHGAEVRGAVTFVEYLASGAQSLTF